jgi:hypothetical protein
MDPHTEHPLKFSLLGLMNYPLADYGSSAPIIKETSPGCPIDAFVRSKGDGTVGTLFTYYSME